METLPEPYATTEALKDRIRACTTLGEVTAVTAEIAEAAKAHQPLDPAGIAQLRNLATWQREAIASGWTRKKEPRDA